MTALINAKLIIGNKVIEDQILLFNNKIIDIDSNININDVDTIDAKGAYVSPGFIDIHIHGSGGVDVMDATPLALETLSKTLLQTGTTAFLATTMTMSQEKIEAALANIKASLGRLSGAQILGAHLEGPFINASKNGAQDKCYIQSPQSEWIEPYLDIIRIITLAPEVAQGMAFIEMMKRRYPELILSIGHSKANYDESIKAFDAGVSHVTHLFNAMSSYHHRRPGIVGACFDRDEVTADIIADTIHVHPHHLHLSHQMKKGHLILITDAMRAGCMKCGRYDLGGRDVTVSEGKAALADGTLAGSVLRMNEALRNMVEYTEMTLPEAILSVTQLPAEKLRLKKGKLMLGYDADLVIFDKDLNIITTIVEGEVKYQRSIQCSNYSNES
ncbi:MAG: N-acetylglucosamine-6-phosphate deacetylase [Sulfurovum sp.]|nr:N-acetylglucosamine-6-phosphate deacetylase [Sulfurovum sp.]MCB4744886.1 N-acetylglucosamine-6-phosphate deacetylase [Sulfurovum sp.]MCB4750109.1 N-acetylglucosamine-6-phosphate deacetylase [Sulfurovum sp.]MCB4752617.1 N-acetylglucosamine-6-phosphate deacetylase [Sulfurovum sp.]MCB4754022.1 N-acetylglucosamine-6-phosphate deacetylase [Sulfurovum sp.]